VPSEKSRPRPDLWPEGQRRIGPFSFAINARSGIILPHDNLIQRRLSHMERMCVDEAALEARLEIEESTSGNSRKKSLTFWKIISIKFF
jgi:hypothetical protein